MKGAIFLYFLFQSEPFRLGSPNAETGFEIEFTCKERENATTSEIIALIQSKVRTTPFGRDRPTLFIERKKGNRNLCEVACNGMVQ